MRNGTLWKMLFKKSGLPFKKRVTVYWLDIASSVLLLLLHLDIHQLLGMGKTSSTVYWAVTAGLIVLPVLDLWPVAFPPPEEEPTGDPVGEALRDHTRAEVCWRMAYLIVPVVYLLIAEAGTRALMG